jgi:hypothetical protein
VAFPSLTLAHADWSVAAPKRMLARGTFADGRANLEAVEPVGEFSTLVQRLEAARRPVLLGVDFPLGVPLAWAQRAKVDSFRGLLAQAGQGRFARFFEVASSPEELHPTRPFYPLRPHGASRAAQALALGVESAGSLKRACDVVAGAECLFWTLGPKQVGKGALLGWRELLQPQLRREDFGLWPLDGTLGELLERCAVVVAETYPAACARSLGLGRFAKGDVAQRKRVGAALLQWAASHAVTVDSAVRTQVQRGFDSDDAFDCVVGFLGQVQVLRGEQPEGAAPPGDAGHVEGWILGVELQP